MQQKLRNDGIVHTHRLEEAYMQAQEESIRLMRLHPTVFDEACKAARSTLHTNSPHPIFGIRNGFFKVEINESTRVAKISDLDYKLTELPADVEAVVEKIRIEYTRFFGRGFHCPNFFKKIRVQYKKNIEKEQLNDGASVPIREITNNLKKKDKEFQSPAISLDEIIRRTRKADWRGDLIKERAIKQMKTKWGTCNILAKRIWINLDLAKKPEDCLEYIIVHELLHLLEKHHNDNFKTLMDKDLTDWIVMKDILNRFPLSHEEWEY